MEREYLWAMLARETERWQTLVGSIGRQGAKKAAVR